MENASIGNNKLEYFNELSAVRTRRSDDKGGIMKVERNNMLVFILTMGVFGILNTEMGVIGILPLIADNYHVVYPAQGWS